MTAVLIVEDEALVRLDIAAELKAAGFEVIEAETADQGLASFWAFPNLKAAVVDIHLPGQMNGYDLILEIRRRRPDTCVIIISGSAIVFPDSFNEGVFVERKPCNVRRIAALMKTHARVGSC